jgi:hypothetical protein
MQGIGVSTPHAAAVAAATAGLAREKHIPNGITFTSDTLSIIVAAGVPVSVRFAGSTARELGAIPKLHCRVAPEQVSILTVTPLRESHSHLYGKSFPESPKLSETIPLPLT